MILDAVWERRRERKAREEARRREFELAVGGIEQLRRLIAQRFEEWFLDRRGEAAPRHAFDYQAKSLAQGLVDGWASSDEPSADSPAEYVDKAIAKFLGTMDASKALGMLMRR